MRETRLRWFGHVKRRSENAPVRRRKKIDLSGCRTGKGRPEKNWHEVIRNDLKLVDLMEDMAQDRSQRRSRIKV